MADVTAIITCMTDAERPFVADAIRSVQRQTAPTDITLCVMEDNDWIDDILASVEPGVELLRLRGGWVGAVRNRAIERADRKSVV